MEIYVLQKIYSNLLDQYKTLDTQITTLISTPKYNMDNYNTLLSNIQLINNELLYIAGQISSQIYIINGDNVNIDEIVQETNLDMLKNNYIYTFLFILAIIIILVTIKTIIM
jgi:tyrosine-protein phosphatase YwqE